MATRAMAPKIDPYHPDYDCLAVDVASLPKDVGAGKVAYVTNTGNCYLFDGVSWVVFNHLR